MTCRITVHVRISDNTIFTHIKFPTTMWIKSAGRNIYLITSTIHIINKYTGYFCKNLSTIFLSHGSIFLDDINYFSLFTRKNISSLNRFQSQNILWYTTSFNCYRRKLVCFNTVSCCLSKSSFCAN
ncbi:hypothetical protein D3C84_569490 [compost metagenome]